jgi:hypothetical protein
MKMKTWLSLLGGALTITEQGGVVSLNWDESLGGGKAAGILVGQGSLKLSALVGLQLGEQELNSELPASVEPVAEAVEGVVNAAVTALE